MKQGFNRGGHSVDSSSLFLLHISWISKRSSFQKATPDKRKTRKGKRTEKTLINWNILVIIDSLSWAMLAEAVSSRDNERYIYFSHHFTLLQTSCVKHGERQINQNCICLPHMSTSVLKLGLTKWKKQTNTNYDLGNGRTDLKNWYEVILVSTFTPRVKWSKFLFFGFSIISLWATPTIRGKKRLQQFFAKTEKRLKSFLSQYLQLISCMWLPGQKLPEYHFCSQIPPCRATAQWCKHHVISLVRYTTFPHSHSTYSPLPAVPADRSSARGNGTLSDHSDWS